MKLDSLRISRRESYESNAGMLAGEVTLKGDKGEMKIALSPASVSAVIATVQAQVQAQAKKNAAQVGNALQDAVDGGLLLANDGKVEIEG